MTARLTMLLLAAAAIAAISAGCGDSDDDASGANGGGSAAITTSSLSKDEFVKQAGKACEKVKEDILERVLTYTQKRESKNPTRAEEAALFADMTRAVVLPTIKKEIAEIQKLGAPEGDEDELEAFIASEQQAIKDVAQLKSIVSRFQLERYFGPSAEMARAYGIEACANA